MSGGSLDKRSREGYGMQVRNRPWRITTDQQHGNASASNGLTTISTLAKAAASLLRN